MKIAVACDHGAFEYKEIVKEMLTEMGHEVEDFGCHGCESVDYPDYAGPAAQSVADGKNDKALPPTRLRESVVRFAVIRLVPN